MNLKDYEIVMNKNLIILKEYNYKIKIYNVEILQILK